MSTVLASSLTLAEVTCWNGGENNPAAQSLGDGGGRRSCTWSRSWNDPKKTVPEAEAISCRTSRRISALVAGRLSVVVVLRTQRGTQSSCRGTVEEDGSRQSPPSGCGRPLGWRTCGMCGKERLICRRCRRPRNGGADSVHSSYCASVGQFRGHSC